MPLWPLLLGAGMWAFLIYMCFFRRNSEVTGCPQCGHEAGLDDDRKHCPESENYSGWVSDLCRCRHDYHWNYESVRE